MAGEIDFRALSPGLDYGSLIASYGAGQQIKAQKAAAALQTRQLERQERIDAQEAAKRTAMAGAINPVTGEIDPVKARQAYASSGDLEGAVAFDATAAKAKATAIEAAVAENAKVQQIVGTAVDQASYEAARAQAQAIGLKVDGLPPQFDIAVIGKLRQQALTVAQQLEAERAKVADELKREEFGYRQQFDAERNALTVRGQDRAAADAAAGRAVTLRGQTVTMRGQDLTASRAEIPSRRESAAERTVLRNGNMKLRTLSNIERQIGEAERALDAAGKAGFTGMIAGRVPGGVSGVADRADKAVAGLAPLIRTLTRVPGEGAMSDYEARLAQASLPSRADTPEGRRQALQDIRALVSETKAGYQDLVGTSAPAPARQAPAARPSRPVAPTRIRGNADYAKLPSGATFIAPDGSTRTKP